jgi:hypothetical protein
MSEGRDVYRVLLYRSLREGDHLAALGTYNGILQDRQCMYHVTQWHVCVNTVEMEIQQCILYVVEVHVRQRIASVAQQYFYGKSTSLATIKCTLVIM